jgi:hypothetical protein
MEQEYDTIPGELHVPCAYDPWHVDPRDQMGYTGSNLGKDKRRDACSP